MLGNFVPLNRHSLRSRNNVILFGIHFLQGIALCGRNEDIFKTGNAVCPGHSVLVYFMTALGSTIQMEGHAFIHTVLGILGHFQPTAFQFIAEGHRCRPAGCNRNLLGGRLHIVIIRLFSNGVYANGQIVHGDGSVCTGLDIFLNPVAGNMELHAGYLAILRRFHQLKAAHSGFHLGIGFHFVRQFNTNDHIL